MDFYDALASMCCNMVHVMPHGNKEDEEFDVLMITQGKEKIGREFEYVDSSGQNSEGTIRKEAWSPPKFDISKQNKSVCDV